jgi:tail tube GTA-gp10-like protein
MANAHRGEVEFTVGKKVYTLKFSTNAMCELETAVGGNVIEMANSLSDTAKMSIRTIRTVFWAGLRDHHEAVTEVEAGRLMDELGLVEASQMIAKAFTLAFPAEVPPAGPLPGLPAGKARNASTGKAH